MEKLNKLFGETVFFLNHDLNRNALIYMCNYV